MEGSKGLFKGLNQRCFASSNSERTKRLEPKWGPHILEDSTHKIQGQPGHPPKERGRSLGWKAGPHVATWFVYRGTRALKRMANSALAAMSRSTGA